MKVGLLLHEILSKLDNFGGIWVTQRENSKLFGYYNQSQVSWVALLQISNVKQTLNFFRLLEGREKKQARSLDDMRMMKSWREWSNQRMRLAMQFTSGWCNAELAKTTVSATYLSAKNDTTFIFLVVFPWHSRKLSHFVLL